MRARFLEALRQVRRDDFEVNALLPTTDIQSAVTRTGYRDHGRLYTAVATVTHFLGQLLRPDRSCQRAVHAVVAHRVATGRPACSPDTGGFCKARQRLPEALTKDLLRQSGRQLEQAAPAHWRWQDRRVRLVDGSTLKIADTPANRAAYPLQRSLIPGTSYPVVRVLVLFALATGGVLDGVLTPYRGKGTSETAMLRGLADHFEPGDVLLGDRYFSGYWDIAWWQRRGVDVVTRLSNGRTADFRRGRRLGPGDHVVTWQRTARPDWVGPDETADYPAALELREVRVRVAVPGFRPDVIIVVTTLLDAKRYPASALAELYRRRWQAELNLRSLKADLGMDLLVTKTPAMARKEFAMYLLAYNCVRRIAAVAASAAGAEPWEISFKGTWQALTEFLARLYGCADVVGWLEGLLWTVGRQRVGDRPNRHEPYATKRRPKDYPTLRESRADYKRRHRLGP